MGLLFSGAYESNVDITREEDPDKFLLAVNALTPNGGTENIYHACVGVLNVVADKTEIIVFTDEFGDDEPEYFDSCLALAIEKQCTISIIFTETL